MTRVRFNIEGELDMGPEEVEALKDMSPESLLERANWGMTVDFEAAGLECLCLGVAGVRVPPSERPCPRHGDQAQVEDRRDGR